MQVYPTRTYERAVRKLLGEEARREMEAAIIAAPDSAPVIRGDRRDPQATMGRVRTR